VFHQKVELEQRKRKGTGIRKRDEAPVCRRNREQGGDQEARIVRGPAVRGPYEAGDVIDVQDKARVAPRLDRWVIVG
jgi:hypothetical protein